VATLPPRSISILPSADALPVQQAPVQAAEPAALPVEKRIVENPLWRNAALVLGGLWLLTLLLWWLSRREGRPAAAREPQPPPVYKQQSRLVKQARRAAREGDLRTVKASLL